MATQDYKVKAPDGQIITVRGPAGASQAEVISQAQKLYGQRQQAQAQQPARQPATLPVPASRAAKQEPEEPGLLDRIGQALTGSDRETRATEELPELQNSGLLAGLDIPVGQRAAISTALATMTSPEEIAETLKNISPDIGIQYDDKGNIIAANNRTGARAMINKPGVSGLDVAQATAIGSAFTPAGRLSTAVGGGIARQAAVGALGSAATQAAIEGSQAAAGGEFDPGEVALAGALGGGVPLVAGAVGSAVDAGRRGIAAMRGAPGAQAPIVQEAARANIPLMTSDVAQPSTFIGRSAQTVGERIPLAGTGGLRATQQEARQRAVQELGAMYPEPSADQVVSSLARQTSKVKQAAGKRYQELVPMVDQLGPVQYAKTTQAIDDAIKELSKPGVVGSKEAVQELQQFKNTLASADQTYSSLKENRTALRDVVSSYDAMGRSQLPTRAKALLNNVYSAITSDMDDAAKAALSPQQFKKLKEANAVYANEAAKLTRTRLKNVLDKGDITPEIAENLIFSKRPSEVRSLYGSLDTAGKQAVRATVVQRAISKAGGIENVSPDKFLSELRRMEAQTGILFKGDERRQIEGLKQVLEATKRAGEAGVQTATGQQLYAPVGAAAAGSLIGDFGVTLAAGATAGGIARLYESPVVRNALIRIGSAPKSDASKRLALQLARQMNAGVQSARALGTEEQGTQQRQAAQ